MLKSSIENTSEISESKQSKFLKVFEIRFNSKIISFKFKNSLFWFSSYFPTTSVNSLTIAGFSLLIVSQKLNKNDQILLC